MILEIWSKNIERYHGELGAQPEFYHQNAIKYTAGTTQHDDCRHLIKGCWVDDSPQQIEGH